MRFNYFYMLPLTIALTLMHAQISLESMSPSSCLIRDFESSRKCHFHIQATSPTLVNGFEKLLLIKSCVLNILMSADFLL